MERISGEAIQRSICEGKEGGKRRKSEICVLIIDDLLELTFSKMEKKKKTVGVFLKFI